MMDQLRFSDEKIGAKREPTRRAAFPAEMEALIPWPRLMVPNEPANPKAGKARRPYALETRLRICFMQQWFTTYIRTHEGWLYLAVVVDLFSRQSVGWSMDSRMSRGSNCDDNAVAESLFQLLKRERIQRKIYTTREMARQDTFDYIEMFYNPTRRHSHADNLSPANYEQQYFSEAPN